MSWARRVALALAVIAVGPPAAGAVHQAVASSMFAWRFPPPGTRVDVGSRTLHVVCEGDGDTTVVLVHGLGGSTAIWSALTPRLVSAGYRVCAWDRAGHGWSVGQTDGSLRATLDDLERVRSALGDGPALWVAHSYGAYVVRGWAARHPDDVGAAVFVDGAHPHQLSGPCTPACLPEPMPSTFFAFYEAMPRLAALGPLRAVVAWAGVPLAGEQEDLPAHDHARLVQAALRTSQVLAAHREAGRWVETAAAVDGMAWGDAPLAVISARDPFEHPPDVDPEAVAAAWGTLQDDLATLSPVHLREVRDVADHDGLLTRDPSVAAVVEAVMWADQHWVDAPVRPPDGSGG